MKNFKSAGENLKSLRVERRMTTREVQELSRHIASNHGSDDYYISHSSLSEIENSSVQPSIQKLYSLSEIYQTSFLKLLEFFNIDIEAIARTPLVLPFSRTRLVESAIEDPSRAITFPAQFRPDLSLDKTNLLSEMVAEWGEIPLNLLQHLNLREFMYGYIGREDYTLYPMVRPGSFVQIDGDDRTVRRARWRNEFERPIYFLQLREGYACGWCEMNGKDLSILPHTLSHVSIRTLRHPDDVEVLGRVSGLATPLSAAHFASLEPERRDQIPEP